MTIKSHAIRNEPSDLPAWLVITIIVVSTMAGLALMAFVQ